MRRTLSTALAAVATAGVIVAGTGLAATPAAAAQCGFYRTNVTAFYNHCGPDEAIWIKVDRINRPDREQCVRQGITDIGGANEVRNAYYLRKCL